VSGRGARSDRRTVAERTEAGRALRQVVGAFGVSSYIALAGLWGSPISGASMNPVRTFGPDLVSTTFTDYWVYIAGPLAGAVIAVVIAFVLRGGEEYFHTNTQLYNRIDDHNRFKIG
jgi:Major intrinsic protein